MAIDLSKMSEKELVRLQGDLEKEMQSREKSKRTEARKAAEDAAKKHGFSLDDLLGGGRSASRGSSRKAPSPPRFRNPENSDQTWSGRGRQPDWYKTAIQSGVEPSALAI